MGAHSGPQLARIIKYYYLSTNTITTFAHFITSCNLYETQT